MAAIEGWFQSTFAYKGLDAAVGNCNGFIIKLDPTLPPPACHVGFIGGKPAAAAAAAAAPGTQGAGAGKAPAGGKKRSNNTKIRDLQRLLRKNDKLPATIRLEKERLLASLLLTKGDNVKAEKEKALATKYHKVKFFERVKVDRKLQQTKKKLKAATDKKEKKSLAAAVAQCEDDLRYIKEFPKDKKYISILKTDDEMDPDSVTRRAAIKTQVLGGGAKAADAGAAAKVEEPKSAGMEDDFFVQASAAEVAAPAAAAAEVNAEGEGDEAAEGQARKDDITAVATSHVLPATPSPSNAGRYVDQALNSLAAALHSPHMVLTTAPGAMEGAMPGIQAAAAVEHSQQVEDDEEEKQSHVTTITAETTAAEQTRAQRQELSVLHTLPKLNERGSKLQQQNQLPCMGRQHLSRDLDHNLQWCIQPERHKRLYCPVSLTDGVQPYHPWSSTFAERKVLAGYKHTRPDGCTQGLYKIILSCLETNAEDRPNFVTLAAALTGLRAGSPALSLQNHSNDAAYIPTDANRIDEMIAALSETPVLSLREAVAKAEPHCKRDFETQVAFATSFAELYIESESGQKHAAGMTVTDVATIHFYSQETVFYSKMNGVMGGYGPDGTTPLPQYLPYIRLLTIAMSKLEQTSAVGYRAIRNVAVDTLLQGKGLGGYIIWPAFTSCTLDPDVLRDPSFLGIGRTAGYGERIVCKIHVSTAVQIEHFSEKGSSADYYLNPVNYKTGKEVLEQNEQEMLLFPGTTFEILGINTQCEGVTEVELREVPTTREFPDHLVQPLHSIPAPLEVESLQLPPNGEVIDELYTLLSPHLATDPVKTCVKTATYNPRDKVLQLARDDVYALRVAVDKVTSELQTLSAVTIEDASRRIDEDLRESFRVRNKGITGNSSVVPLKTRLSEAEQFLNHYVHQILSECTLPLDGAAAVLQTLNAVVIDPIVLLVKEEIVAMCKDVCTRPKAYMAEVNNLGDDDKVIYERTFNKMVKDAADRHAYHDMIAAADNLQAKFSTPSEVTQPVKDLLMLTIKVREVRPQFEDIVSKAVANIEGVEPPKFRGKTKALYRMIEKSILKGPQSTSGVGGLLELSAANLDCSEVLDVFAGLIVCKHFKAMQDAIEQIGRTLAPSRGSGTICRIKNRWKEETGGGWKDLMLNVEVDGVVFEMQLVHIELYNARKLMGGHKAYAKYRCYLELLTFTGQLGIDVDAHTADQFKYDIVFSHTHDQLTFVEGLIQGMPHGLKCFSEKDLDKTNPDCWAFEWRCAYKAARLCICVLTREYLATDARCIEWAVMAKDEVQRIVIAADSTDNIVAGVRSSKGNAAIINHLEAGYDVETCSRSTINELCAKIQWKLKVGDDGNGDDVTDADVEEPIPVQLPLVDSTIPFILPAAAIDILVIVDFPTTADGGALEPAKYVAPFRKFKEALDETFNGKQVRIRFHTPRSLVQNDAGLLSTKISCVCWIALGEEAAPDVDAVFTSSLWKSYGGKCGLAIVLMKHGAEWVAEQLNVNCCADRVVWVAAEYSGTLGIHLLTKKLPGVLRKALTGAKLENEDDMRKSCNLIFDYTSTEKRNIASDLLLIQNDGGRELEMIKPLGDGDRIEDDAGISLHRIPSNPEDLTEKTFDLQKNLSVDLNQWPSSRQLQDQISKRHGDGWRLITVTGGEYSERKMVVWDAVQSFLEPRSSGTKRFDYIVYRDVTSRDARDWKLPFKSHSAVDVLLWLDSRDSVAIEELSTLFEEWSDDLLPWTVVVTATSSEDEEDEDGIHDDIDVNRIKVPPACGTTLNDSCADLIRIVPHVTSVQLEDDPALMESKIAEFADLERNRSEFDLNFKIGKFSEVWKGYSKNEGDVAIQVVKSAKHISREVLVLQKCDNEHIVKILGVVTATSPFYVVVELCKESLFVYIQTAAFEMDVFLRILWEAASGLNYLHANNCIHRDVASWNILIGNTGTVKISGFKKSIYVKHCADVHTLSDDDEYFVRWAAPEVFASMNCSLATDVWAFGILIWEVFALGRVPYPGLSNLRVQSDVSYGYRMCASKRTRTPGPVLQLMYRCWMQNAEDRPTMAGVMDCFAELREFGKRYPTLQTVTMDPAIVEQNRSTLFSELSQTRPRWCEILRLKYGAHGPAIYALAKSADIARYDTASGANEPLYGTDDSLYGPADDYGTDDSLYGPADDYLYYSAASGNGPVYGPADKIIDGSELTVADFTYIKLIGRGSFGKVMLAEVHGCDDVVAIKILKKTSVVEDDDVVGAFVEKRVLELASGSPFLCKLHATFHTDAHLYFVTEFVNGGDLMYHIQNQRVFPPKQSRFYAAQILLALWYLHENGVVYRDVKLDNVMLDAYGHIKLIDFGMAKENMFGGARTTTFCGTPGYLAPEIIKETPYGASVDFWSLGILCYEFLVGDSPFEADEDDELFDQICNAPLEWPAKLDPSAKDFVNRLLDRNPTTRIGCGPTGKADIQRHAFFSGIDWGKMASRQIPPPFRPIVKDPRSTEHFDNEFTDEPAIITPIDKAFVAQIEQAEFQGFSFVNKTGLLAQFGGADRVSTRPINKRDLRQFPWYRPQLNRSDVVRLLKGKAAGAFCVRESASQPGCFALSVSVSPKADKLWTGLITPTDDGRGGERYRLFVKQKFDNIPDLIKFYHTSPCVTINQGRREVCLVDAENYDAMLQLRLQKRLCDAIERADIVTIQKCLIEDGAKVSVVEYTNVDIYDNASNFVDWATSDRTQLSSKMVAGDTKADSEQASGVGGDGFQRNGYVDNSFVNCPNGATPLAIAISAGNVAVVKLLLDHNADVNIADDCDSDDCDSDDCDSDSVLRNSATPLVLALNSGNNEVLKILLENNADCNAILANACDDDLDAVKMLLENNANPSVPDLDGCTPMQIAAHKGHIDVANLLLKVKRCKVTLFRSLANAIASQAIANAVAETVSENEGIMKLATKTKTRLKVVIVGDGYCGKTCLLQMMSENRFQMEYAPTVFENYVADIEHDGQSIALALWDTAGHLDYDRLRPLAFPDTDVVLISYSIVDPDSLENVQEKWVPEIQHFCPGVPFLLVGCKSDARSEPSFIKDLAQKGQKPVPAHDGQNTADKIGAFDYLECSAKEKSGILDVFHRAVTASSPATYMWSRVLFGGNVAWYTPSTTSILALLEINGRSKFVKAQELDALQTFLVAASQESRATNCDGNAERFLAMAMLFNYEAIAQFTLSATVKPEMSFLVQIKGQ
eukprot:gene3730-1502_t